MDDIISGDSLLTVSAVKPLENYLLYLKFNNGEERIFDVKPLLDKPVFRPLKNTVLFMSVHIIYDYTIAWNESIDMCPDSLYLSSIPYKKGSSG